MKDLTNEKYLDKSEEIQEWIHTAIDMMIDKGSTTEYEDLYRTAVSLKMGEMIVRIEELEAKNATI